MKPTKEQMEELFKEVITKFYTNPKLMAAYEEFADNFNDLCEEYSCEDFNTEVILQICRKVIEGWS